jgi:hypothetical protein
MEKQLEEQLSVASCQLSVPTLSPKQGDNGGAPAHKLIQDRLQVLIPQYFDCKLPGINTLHGSAQSIQNRELTDGGNHNAINTLQAKYSY